MKVGTLILILQKWKDYKRILWTFVTNELDSLNKMYKFLETHKLPKQIQEEIDNFNRSVTSKKVKSVI